MAANYVTDTLTFQGIGGQSIVSDAVPLDALGSTLALGFSETAVRFAYRARVTLPGYTSDPAALILSARLWSMDGTLAETVFATPSGSGDTEFRGWLNPDFAAAVSVKGDRWLRRGRFHHL